MTVYYGEGERQGEGKREGEGGEGGREGDANGPITSGRS
jgi:hypothetical protein